MEAETAAINWKEVEEVIVGEAQWAARKHGLPIDELVSEGWVVAARCLDSYDARKGPFCAYVRISVRRAYLACGRERSRRPSLVRIQDESELEAPDREFGELLSSEAYRNLLSLVIGALQGSEYAGPFMLYSGFLDGLRWGIEEIEYVFSITRGAARHRIHRACQLLRKPEVRDAFLAYFAARDIG